MIQLDIQHFSTYTQIRRDEVSAFVHCDWITTSLVEVPLKVKIKSEPDAATFYDSNNGFSVWRFGQD
jgi:hypothetical protein